MVDGTNCSLSPDYFSSEEMQFMDPGQIHWRLTVRTPVWRPPTDVFETDEALIVRVEIAGMSEEDFAIELDDRFLSIRGVRTETIERRAYHQMEIRFGEFSAEVELLVPIVAAQVVATYGNGFLRVVLPKARSRHIQVEE